MVSKIDATIMKNFSSTKSPFGGGWASGSWHSYA